MTPVAAAQWAQQKMLLSASTPRPPFVESCAARRSSPAAYPPRTPANPSALRTRNEHVLEVLARAAPGAPVHVAR